MTQSYTPFPTLATDDRPAEQWQWPKPPFVWQHAPAPDISTEQPCLVKTTSGEKIKGELLTIDVLTSHLRIRRSRDRDPLSIKFSDVRFLVLPIPLKPMESFSGGPVECLPTAAEKERSFSLRPREGGRPLHGRTVGHVETDEGLFLFSLAEKGRALRRSFIPRSAYAQCEFGATAEEIASKCWIKTPHELLAAIQRQPSAFVLPIGQAIFNLGVITQEQLDQVTVQEDDEIPLGERLVANGSISESDLKTALAHKMGYPMVDLTQFPIDPSAARKIPTRLALDHNALPLLIVEGQRLVVAVADPSCVPELSKACYLPNLTIVPVVATEAKITAAIRNLSQQSSTANVGGRSGLFA